MRIVTYDEIDPEQANLLTLVCFGMPMTPGSVELIRKLDKRTSDYYGIYALDDSGRALSQVIVLHIDTKTREGVEKVAGLASVGTLPSHARRGLSKALIKRAHELSRERGMRISTLTTSASLVSFNMYTQLGYSTISTFNRGIKYLSTTKPQRAHPLKLRTFKLCDAEPLDRAFASQTENALGFVCRQPAYLAMRVRTLQTSAKKIQVATMKGRTVGYAYANLGEDYSEINDLVAANDLMRLRILNAVEYQQKARWLSCTGVCDRNLSNLYATHGFNISNDGWGRVMATSIDQSLTNEDIVKLYGVDEGRFVMNTLDSF